MQRVKMVVSSFSDLREKFIEIWGLKIVILSKIIINS